MLKRLKIQLIFIIISCPFTFIAQSPFLEWVKTTGGPNNDAGRAIATDQSGNIYTTGHFENSVDFDSGNGTFTLTSNGVWDIFILKTDQNGNLLWAKQIGGQGIDEGTSIFIDQKNNIYLTGLFSETCDFDPGPGVVNLTSVTGSNDIFVAKYSTAGELKWARAMGGNLHDYGSSVIADTAGNVYSTGTFQSNVDFDPGVSTYNLLSSGQIDTYISKLDSSGNFIFTKQIGGSLFDYGEGLALDQYGSIHMIGMFQDTIDFDPGVGTFNLISKGGYDVFLLKLDANGDFNWVKQFGGTGWDHSKSITIGLSNNIFIAGGFMGTSDFDPGPDTTNLTSLGIDVNAFISKLNNLGDLIWVKQMPGTLNNGSSFVASITVDVNGTIYTTGGFNDTTDFDPGPGTAQLFSSGSNDIFLSILNDSGDYLWAGKMGGTLDDVAYSICIDGYNNVYSTGFFSQTGDFDPFSPIHNITSNGFLDIYCHKMNSIAVGISEIKADSQINIYPNPSDGLITIDLLYNSTIIITDVLGQEIVTVFLNPGRQHVNIKNHPSGVYFLNIITENKISNSQKIIKY